VATKQKLAIGANVIDSSYQGMIYIHVFNFSNTLRFIEFNQKITQLVPVKINSQPLDIFYSDKIEDFKEYRNFVSEEKFYESTISTRGDKGFGEGTGS